MGQLIIFSGVGFMVGRRGAYRILIAAETSRKAAEHLRLELRDFNSRYKPSRIGEHVSAFGPGAQCGDVMVSPRGRKEYEDADIDDVEA